MFDPITSKWTNIANMNVRRSGVACVGFNEFLYVMGGFDGHTRLSSCERYDPSNDEWTSILDMPHQRSNFGIEILDDMIFVIGGYNGLYTLPHCECLDVAENQWSVCLISCTLWTSNKTFLQQVRSNGIENESLRL